MVLDAHRLREHLLRGRVTEKTHNIRVSLLQDLEHWLLPQLGGLTVEALARYHIDGLSEWLEEYMIFLFLQKRRRRAAAETLNALTQQFGWVRWNLLKTWEQLEPVQHHPPMPAQVLFSACGYCSAMALAAHGGHLGFGLFWFAETCRAYWVAKEGLGLTNRHLRKRLAVPPARSTENSASSSQQSACAHRLSGSGHVAFALNRLDPVVEQNLERIVASL